MFERINLFKGLEIQLEYLLTGEKNNNTILFVHGAGGNLRQFLAQHQYFSKNYKVLSVSLRGHGKSLTPIISSAEEYTMKKNACDILELLEYLKIEKVHYVGNSAGGMIGYELVKANPQLFSSFITFGTTAELKWSKFATNIFAGIDKIMLKINPLGYLKFVSKHSSRDEKVQNEIYEILKMTKQAVPYFRQNLGNYSYIEVLENIDFPFLLIQGEEDNDINNNLKTTIKAININKNASYALLGGAGHFANLDKPEEFNNIVEDFVVRWNENFD